MDADPSARRPALALNGATDTAFPSPIETPAATFGHRPDLVLAARRSLAAYPRVRIVNAVFETWSSLGGGNRFDLVFAATAWHWVDPAARYRRAWELLRSEGYLAFWAAGHVVPVNGDSFFTGIQEV